MIIGSEPPVPIIVIIQMLVEARYFALSYFANRPSDRE